MNYKHYLEKHNRGALSDAEWEELFQTLLRVQSDKEKKEIWARTLAENGITRTDPARRTFRSWHTALAAAAALALIVAATWFINRETSGNPAQRLATGYLEQPFPFNEGHTRGDKDMNFNRGRALEAFNNRQFENAVQYLQIVESEGQAKAADYFQLGLCLMYQRRPDYSGALNAFAAARLSDPSVYADEINWFSGLCYLLQNDTRNAKAALQRVIDSPSSRDKAAAEALLKVLKD